MSELAIARTHMVDSQVRPNGVNDTGLISALLELPREKFVGPAQAKLAYAESRLALAPGRYLTEPMILAKLIYFAEIGSDDHVLVVGAATGYATAIIARLAASVVGVEDNADLASQATSNLMALGLNGAKIVIGPLTEGAAASGPFDVIIIDGAVETVPAALTDQLKDKGRLLAVVTDGGTSRGTLFVRAGHAIGKRAVFDAFTASLPGFERPKGFSF